MKCKIAFKNNDKEPAPFYINLTGGTGEFKVPQAKKPLMLIG